MTVDNTCATTASTTSPGAPHHTESDAEVETSKYLTFCLGVEEYGLEILSVREIIGLIDITPLPRTPEYVKGVVNLRGKIIPVIDLRAKFALPEVEHTQETCIIVVEVTAEEDGEQFDMGLLVDSVQEVLDIASNAIEPTPSFGCSIPLNYIKGIGKVKDKVVILLNIDNVMMSSDLSQIQNTQSSSAPSTQSATADTQPGSCRTDAA